MWKFLLQLLVAAAVIHPSAGQTLNLGGTPAPGTTPAPVAGSTPAGSATPTTSAPTGGATQAAAPTQAPVQTWGGCDDLDNPGQPIKLGKKTTICVVLASSTDWSTPPVRLLRLSFQPEADEYSRFHVPSSYVDLIKNQQISGLYNGNNNVTINVASQQQLSYQRVFYTPDTGRLFPYLTAIIDVSKGIVKGITWDDACLFCAQDKCVEDTYDFNGNIGTQKEYKQPTKGCYVDQTKCEDALKNKKPLCDITVYVVWTGDDADGKAFQSSAFRFSAFPAQELQNRLEANLPHFSVPGSQPSSG